MPIHAYLNGTINFHKEGQDESGYTSEVKKPVFLNSPTVPVFQNACFKNTFHIGNITASIYQACFFYYGTSIF